VDRLTSASPLSARLTCLPSNSGLIFFGISLSSCFDDTHTVLP
jgi:hypothetical protein